MILGVDYYPEHWPIEMLEEDIERIADLGANTVRIGEFAWHMMEPEEEKYDFSFFDKVIDALKKKNLNVIFGTPTATFPAWISKKYPDVIAMNAFGERHAFGGRRLYCYNAPAYIQLTEKIVTRLLEHYKNEPAIIAWQIDNELGHEGSDQCYCPHCEAAFHRFLEEKYGEIDILNESYGTIFWGQTYNRFDEIPVPKPTITTHNPSLQLDWARFRSDSINRYAKLQIDIVNRFKRPDQKVTHNLFGGFFDRAYDQNVLAERLDVVSYDNYPVWGGLAEPLSPAHIAMTLDYIRGLKQDNFWILEELMGAQGHTIIGYLPRPNQAKLWSHQAMARGCEALLYFRWRGMTRGAEQFCQGILDSDNKVNHKYLEVKTFFEEVKQNAAMYFTKINAKVAVLYDYDNRWSWHAQPQSHALDYTGEIVRLYKGFHNLNIMMDVISTNKDFSPYNVVILPIMQIVDDSLLNRIKQFASEGGTVVFGFRSGIKDRSNNLRLGENPLNALCGIETFGYESLGCGQSVDILGRHGEAGKVEVWRDLIRTVSAEAIYTYGDTFYDSFAALTVNRIDKGSVYYVGGGICEKTVANLMKRIIEEQNIHGIDSPEGVEVIERDGRWIILNHTGETQVFRDKEIEPYGMALLV